MPSVRPKLVSEGAPIAGNESSDDVAMKAGDNLFVIGGGGANNNNNASKTTFLQQGNSSLSSLVGGGGANNNNASKTSFQGNSSLSSLSMQVSINRPDLDTSKRSVSNSDGKKRSSLARAAKGTFLPDKTVKKSVVETSFVVGGRAMTFNDEKKSADSPMMIDDNPPGKRRGSRTTLTTSYEIPANGNNSYSGLMDVEQASPTATKFVVAPKSSSESPSYITQTHFKVGGGVGDDLGVNADAEEEVEKMEGVIDLSEKPPLLVMDGANIAYAYANAWQGESLGKLEPDARGIVIASEYFLSAGIRVLAVIPTTWTHREPHSKILQKLNDQRIFVSAPSRDDDDAYAITIARREDDRARQRGDGPGYVMSNDMFRDAIQRSQEEGGGIDLKEWLTEGSTGEHGKSGPGRISFAFCATGSLDDHGDKVLDIVPNPRHPLVQFVEQQLRAMS